jgi:hypothetical protein
MLATGRRKDDGNLKNGGWGVTTAIIALCIPYAPGRNAQLALFKQQSTVNGARVDRDGEEKHFFFRKNNKRCVGAALSREKKRRRKW